MDVGLLGTLRIDGTEAGQPLGGPHQRRLLAWLALTGPRGSSVDELEEVVWGDEPPATSRHTLAAYVSRLRHLGLDIATTANGYRLTASTDVAELERLVAEGRQARPDDPRRAARHWRAALALWRGGLTADLEPVAAAQAEVSRLEEVVAALREELLAVELDLGRSRDDPAPADPVQVARQLTAAQPYRERGWELLMLALYRAGRQAEALEAYAECRRLLVDDLGIDPGPGMRRMQQAVLAQDPVLEAPGDAVPAAAGGSRPALPGASTRLIGRQDEQEALSAAWGRTRMVTLVGPPGAGKTRLAVEAARIAGAPVWYVALEQVAPQRSVAAAVLDAVAPSSMAAEAHQGVLQAVADLPGLLVLDGGDRRTAGVAAEVEAILAACPAVRVLVTSRERLGLLDEALIPVGPLAEDDALELLLDRARLVDPRFELLPDQRAGAERLVALVDRLPLGLELVARHLHLLGLDELAARVAADLSRWAGGPSRGRAGLWAALDESTARLTPLESRVMVALAVMVADADTELVAQVIEPPSRPQAPASEAAELPPAVARVDPFEAIARLVDASLVRVRSAAGPTRYELLHTIAVHTLETSDPAAVETARDAYREAVLDRTASLAARLAGPDRPATVAQLDREIPHVRAVLEQCAATISSAAAERALAAAVALTDYWLGRHPAEGLEWLQRLRPASSPESPLWAQAALAASHLAYWMTDFALGRAFAEEARAGFAALGDRLGEGRALRRLGAIAAATDDMEEARRRLEASLASLESTGVEREIGTTLLHLGSLLADQGLSAAARPLLGRALAVAEASEDPLARGHALAALNLADWKGGDLVAAMAEGERALAIFELLGHRPSEGSVSCRLAAVARGLGRVRAARRFALRAIEAGEQTSTRTTTALGHLNLARLDLDGGDIGPAAAHLTTALQVLDPTADRWVLADALEAVARLAVAADLDGAAALLRMAAAVRTTIGQPIAPTEVADVQATRRRLGLRPEQRLGGRTGPRPAVGPERPTEGRPERRAATSPEGLVAAHAVALALAEQLVQPAAAPTPIRRRGT